MAAQGTATLNFGAVPGPYAGQMEIALTPIDTVIRNSSNASEVRRVTIVAQYGSNADQATSEFDYSVINLKFY